MRGRLRCLTVAQSCRSPCCTSAGRKQLSWTAAALSSTAARHFRASMPACTMRGSHIVGRCACTWPPPERDFSSSCSCGLFFNAVSTGAGERSRQNARACTENASNVFWRERGRRRVEPGAASSVAMVESYESSLPPAWPICATA